MGFEWDDLEKHTELKTVATHSHDSYDDYTAKMQAFYNRDNKIRGKIFKKRKFPVDWAWNEFQKRVAK